MTTALIVLACSAVVGLFMFAALIERIGNIGAALERIAAKVGAPELATGDDVVEAFQRGHAAGYAQAREELGANVTPIKPSGPGKPRGTAS